MRSRYGTMAQLFHHRLLLVTHALCPHLSALAVRLSLTAWQPCFVSAQLAVDPHSELMYTHRLASRCVPLPLISSPKLVAHCSTHTVFATQRCVAMSLWLDVHAQCGVTPTLLSIHSTHWGECGSTRCVCGTVWVTSYCVTSCVDRNTGCE